MKSKFFTPPYSYYLIMLTGVFLMSVAYVCFFVPESIAPGGIGGLSVIINSFFPIKVGLITIILNIPIFIFALKELGIKFIIKTGILLLIMSVLIDALPFSIELNDKFLSMLCGAILNGIGLGLVMLTGASTGGTDTLAMTLSSKYKNIKASEILLLLDAVVVITAGFAFGIVKGIYSAFAIIIQTFCIDFVFDGIKSSRAVYIITAKSKELKKHLYSSTNRGVTEISAYGGFSGTEIRMLLCVVSKRELSAVKKCVKNIDANAFMFDTSVKEVIGNGFQRF